MAVTARSPDETLRAFSQGVGAVVALASFLAFLSEAFGFVPARHVFSTIPIQPNQQAFTAMILALALFCQHLEGVWPRRIAQALGVAVAVFCMLVVAEILLGWRQGFETFTIPPGFGNLSGAEFSRISLPSAITLGILGLALAIDGRGHGWPSDLLALTSLGYNFVTALIVALRVQHLTGEALALPTGWVLLIALTLGILASHPDRGVMKALSSESSVGVVLRRLLPTALLTPTLIGWFWVEGQRLGLFDAPSGMFFAVLAMTVVSIAIVAWNITPLARLERARDEAVAALRQSEARASRLAAVVEASEDAITTYAPETWAITYWSRGAEKVWGWPADATLGKKAGFLLHPEDRHLFGDAFADLCAGKHVSAQNIRSERRDGTPLDLSVGLFPIRDDQGRIAAFGSIQRDITEQRRMLLEMARRTAELKKAEELNRLKDHFLSTISHEMKTPLSLITGYAELLEDACPDVSMIEGIKDGSRRLSEHIDNILDYSALISGTLPLYKTDVNLTEVVQHVEALLSEGFQLKNVTLETEVAPDTPVIEGDFRRISQILLELLENAQKFTPPGGKAGIRVMPDDDHVRIDVWNTGEGIPEEDFGRVWEAFTQLATEDAFRKGGLGLGLTIVKRLAELHGGRVAVTSQIGHGATFSVFLPVGKPGGPLGPPSDASGAES